ncbi:MAG: response regulator [Ignavibacteriales bacterium]
MRPVALVADDDTAVRYVIEVALKREGFEVLTAGDGSECISVAASGAPEVILLDLRMPGVSGFEVLRRRDEWDPRRRIPVFVMSGVDDTVDLDLDSAGPVGGVLHKPFDIVHLVAAVKVAVEIARSGGAAVGEGGGAG